MIYKIVVNHGDYVKDDTFYVKEKDIIEFGNRRPRNDDEHKLGRLIHTISFKVANVSYENEDLISIESV